MALLGSRLRWPLQLLKASISLYRIERIIDFVWKSIFQFGQILKIILQDIVRIPMDEFNDLLSRFSSCNLCKPQTVCTTKHRIKDCKTKHYKKILSASVKSWQRLNSAFAGTSEDAARIRFSSLFTPQLIVNCHQ